jgi:hypothetical protein
MKVAIIDNTCNNGYVLMRYLNDRGIDTDLLLFGPVEGHADPENDTFNHQYSEKIFDTGWSKKGLLWLTKKDIKKYTDKYDFVIGSDYAPAVFYRIKRTLDIFLPHGTDIFSYPFMKIESFSKKSIGEFILAYWQRKGIAEYSRYFMFELTNEENEKYVKYFKKNNFKRIYKTVPLVYNPQYSDASAEKFSSENEKVKILSNYKKEGYTIVFHHCQQQWKNPVHLLFNKGNDKLIHGLRKYLDLNPAAKIKLVMVERGTDIENSKALIKELSLEDYVIWFPVMPRKEIMACLSQADLGIGELGHSWYNYCVITEFMALGIPVIHYCDIDYYKTVNESIYPMYSVNTADQISEMLKTYFENPAAVKQTGQEGKIWWQKHMVSDTVDLIVDCINKK